MMSRVVKRLPYGGGEPHSSHSSLQSIRKTAPAFFAHPDGASVGSGALFEIS